MKTPTTLSLFVRCLQKVHDSHSKQGQSHQFTTVLALIFLGLLAKISTLAELQRWSELHFHELKTLLTAVKKTRILNESRELIAAQ